MSPPRQGWPLLKSGIVYSFKTLPPVVKVLLAVLSALYLAAIFLQPIPEVARFLALVSLSGPDLAAGEVWRLVTYFPFHLRQDLFGFLFDVLILWSLGKIFAHRWRQRDFLLLYLLGAVGGGLAHLLAWLVLPNTFSYPQLGSSGATFALFAAFWRSYGEMLVSVFGSRPMKGKWVFYAILALETIFFAAGNNPHFAVQLGGICTGWLLVTGYWRPSRLLSLATARGRRLGQAIRHRRRRFKVVHFFPLHPVCDMAASCVDDGGI